jgi:hypothetical protein
VVLLNLTLPNIVKKPPVRIGGVGRAKSDGGCGELTAFVGGYALSKTQFGWIFTVDSSSTRSSVPQCAFGVSFYLAFGGPFGNSVSMALIVAA